MPPRHDLTTTTVPLATLRPHPRNPRNGDTDVIAESLDVNGQYAPIVVARDGTVLVGNHRYAAALELGWDRIAVIRLDLGPDDPEALRIMVADNGTSDRARNDEALLLELLRDLDDLQGTAYDGDGLADLAAAVAAAGDRSLLDVDADVPAVPETPISRVGDVWDLGPHRLAVGDCTDSGVWEALMPGEEGRCVWTDPPYGVNYQGATADKLTIQGDGRDKGAVGDLLRRSLSEAIAHCTPGAAVYVAGPDGPNGAVFVEVMASLGCWRQTLIWVKNALVLGSSDYQPRHEPLFYGYTPGYQGRRGRGGSGGRGWYGDNTQTTVLEYPKPLANREHPTMKPVDLVAHCLRNSVRAGEVVVDPFAGSGTTMLAAARVGAVARLIEVDPRYADVIAARWQLVSGDLPIRAGETVDFTADRATVAG